MRGTDCKSAPSGERLTENSRDFHIVSGVIPKDSNNPMNVYSKNGARPVFGPQNITSWRPATKDLARTNNASNQVISNPQYGEIYKVRVNMKQTIYRISPNKIPNKL